VLTLAGCALPLISLPYRQYVPRAGLMWLLLQNRSVFVIGILCLLAGLGVVLFTLADRWSNLTGRLPGAQEPHPSGEGAIAHGDAGANLAAERLRLWQRGVRERDAEPSEDPAIRAWKKYAAEHGYERKSLRERLGEADLLERAKGLQEAIARSKPAARDPS